MKIRSILLVLLLLAAGGNTLRAIEREAPQSSQRDSLYWEKVIQSYTEFCRLYDDAKAKGVSSSAALQQKAADIKALLKESHGRMTQSQYRRFERLREKHSGIPEFPGIGETSSPVTKVVKEVRLIKDTVVIIKDVGRKDTVWVDASASNSASVRKLTLPVVNPSPVSCVQALCADALQSSSSLSYPRPISNVIRVLDRYYVLYDNTLHLIKYPPSFTARLSAIPDFIGGGCKVSLGFQYRRRFGVYADLNDLFYFENPLKSDYSCQSDGTTSYGKIWTTGEKRGSLFSVTGGGVARLDRHWTLYAGAGYGDWKYQWKDVDGLWADVSDISCKGLVLEAGVAYRLFGPLGISVGTQTIGFDRYTLKIGLQYTGQ